MSIADQYRQINENVQKKTLACGRQLDEVTLIAVSKTYSVEFIQPVYQVGGRNFGESRVQEALGKIPHLPRDCQWHFIGHLQSNKIAKVVSTFQLIHSVDSFFLAEKISQISQAKNLITPILLQVNTSGEATKQGLSAEEWGKMLENLNQLPSLKIEGLMTMAPFTENRLIIRACFRKLYELRESWRKEMKAPLQFRHLSMGMSHDYEIAIEEGATLLRIGSSIFGSRN